MADKPADICEKCGQECKLPCIALSKLYELYNTKRNEQRNEILQELKGELNLIDAEVADDLKEMADKIIDKYPSLHFIRDFDIHVGYVKCNEAKKDKGRVINAECIKVKPWMMAYLPYNFIIVFYEYNIAHMTDNQRKILMLHELQHITIGPRGLKIRLHDTEDFDNILSTYGLSWNDYDVDAPDILE